MALASSRIGRLFSSRVISASNMFIAILRVEIVAEVIWSRLLMLASWPKVKLPPTRGHLNGSARTCAAPIARLAIRPQDKGTARHMILPLCVIASPARSLSAALGQRDETRLGRQGTYAVIAI